MVNPSENYPIIHEGVILSVSPTDTVQVKLIGPDNLEDRIFMLKSSFSSAKDLMEGYKFILLNYNQLSYSRMEKVESRVQGRITHLEGTDSIVYLSGGDISTVFAKMSATSLNWEPKVNDEFIHYLTRDNANKINNHFRKLPKIVLTEERIRQISQEVDAKWKQH
ncbi:MAG: hypothetical protein AABX11_00745 [Nanoarchaeota archaeon]